MRRGSTKFSWRTLVRDAGLLAALAVLTVGGNCGGGGGGGGGSTRAFYKMTYAEKLLTAAVADLQYYYPTYSSLPFDYYASGFIDGTLEEIYLTVTADGIPFPEELATYFSRSDINLYQYGYSYPVRDSRAHFAGSFIADISFNLDHDAPPPTGISFGYDAYEGRAVVFANEHLFEYITTEVDWLDGRYQRGVVVSGDLIYGYWEVNFDHFNSSHVDYRRYTTDDFGQVAISFVPPFDYYPSYYY